MEEEERIRVLDVRLVRSSTNDGLAPYSDVTEGVYNIRELSDIFVILLTPG